ncbi:WD40 repeat domain-containing protein [Euzebya tangerina]|uniref:WD40 repeat domain-containing protein n=1 Tax=Euzebya tangerina TaxID=591198 RepID=UPI0013C340EC|nr:WD40 repeat domain-containing protein [Euzebya tangerina]
MNPTVIGTAAPGWPASGAVRDGNRIFIVSRNLDRTRLVEVDARDLSIVRQRVLPGGDGAWALTVGPDGIYVGTFGAKGRANLFRLDGASTTGVAALSVDYIWELADGSNGSVYGVTSGPAMVFEYSTATRRARSLGLVEAGDRPRTITVRDGKVIVGGSRRGKAFLFDRDIDGGGPTRDLLPNALRLDATVYCSTLTPAGRIIVGTGGSQLDEPAIAVIDRNNPRNAQIARLPREALVDRVALDGSSVFATSRPSGALYRFDLDSDQLFRLDVPVPMSETRDLSLMGRSALGVSADGTVWSYSRTSDSTITRDPQELGLPLRPERAQSIGVGSRHVYVGGSFSLTRRRLTDNAATTRFVPGEPKAMVSVGTRMYFALYPLGEIWFWGEGASSPRRLTQLDSDQLRPISLVHLPQLDALVCTTTDDVDRSVLNTIDPTTGRVDTLVNPLGRQTLSGLATRGSTIFVGGSGGAPSVAAFDAVSGEREWTIPNVIPDGGFVLGLQVVAGRLALTTSRGWFTTIDLNTLAVAEPVRVSAQGGQLRRDGDRLLLATGDALLRLNPNNRTSETVLSGLDGQFWNWPPLDTNSSGQAYVVRGRRLIRVP